MRHSQVIFAREQPARLLALGIRFFLTAALTASQTPGGYAPFALGCVAVSGHGAEGIAALLGAGAGALLFLEFMDALPFLAVAVLMTAAAAAFRGLRVMDKPAALPLLSAVLFLSVEGIYVIQSLSPADRAATPAAIRWGA